ncbi:MAG: ImmA/IrrE family metallo-endopeptidase, partial [Bacteroidota bacterium]
YFVEKGKKYPKQDKVVILAKAMETSFEELSSPNLTKKLAPVGELLQSNFLSELPLDLFGIELNKVVEIIANAPLRVGAFISTLVELSRNYALREESFYFGAMRSYQELHYNYFESIEDAAKRFVQQYDIPQEGAVSDTLLANILTERFGYEIVENGLKTYPDLENLRAVVLPQKKKLFLNPGLNATERAFQLSKELAFNYLDLKERSNTSSLTRVTSFEQVLNHFKAVYFSAAVLINREAFVEDMKAFFSRSKWNGEAFVGLMRTYQISPEIFYGRLTNLIPRFFGLKKLFFLRVNHQSGTENFQVDKELHLNHHHHPHGNQIYEHYCRRWMSLSLLKDLQQMQAEGKYVGTIVGAQRSRYHGTEDEYLCFTLARSGFPTPNVNVSVTIGLLLDDELKEKVRFWNDPSIASREVNKTCERCVIKDCKDRIVPASIVEKKEKRKRIQESIRKIMDEY